MAKLNFFATDILLMMVRQDNRHSWTVGIFLRRHCS